MKKIMMVLMIVAGVSSVAFGQTNMSKDKNDSIGAQLIAMEKQAWETWKNQDRSFQQSLLSEDAVAVSDTGVAGKTQFLNDIFTDCKVKSYSVDNFKVVMLEKNTALMTYKATQDAMCGGKQMPATQWASSMYMKRGGKWLNVFYQTSNVQ